MSEGVEALRAYYRSRYGKDITDAEVERIIERETGGRTTRASEYGVLPGGFEVLRPTWSGAPTQRGGEG